MSHTNPPAVLCPERQVDPPPPPPAAQVIFPDESNPLTTFAPGQDCTATFAALSQTLDWQACNLSKIFDTFPEKKYQAE